MRPDPRGRRVEGTGVAVAAAVREALAGGAAIVQSLLDSGQEYEQQALEAGGLHRLARLVYLQKTLPSVREVPRAWATNARLIDGVDPATVEVVSYETDTHELFSAAVLESYEGTLDCPGLLGRRSAEDILAGHRATGIFKPEWWRVVTVAGRPAGVLMLAGVYDDDAFELVYLGVSPAFRRKGLARRLLDEAVAMAVPAGGRKLLLAVDDQNDPAVRLYRQAGFRTLGTKLAMVTDSLTD